MPNLPMTFEAWSKNRTYEDRFAATRQLGMDSYLVTWESWQPTARGLKIQDQAAVQPGWTSADIAAGKHDDYVRRWARTVRDSGLKNVYMRFNHEMNGDWFPWYHDQAGYIEAWKHVVDIFRAERASNARWVWSINPSLYQDDTTWLNNAKLYWPGPDYVDYLGSTMISFGGKKCPQLPCSTKTKDYDVRLFAQRIEFAYQQFDKPVVITEANTDFDGRLRWLRDLQEWVQTATYVRVVVISQAPSRAAAASIGSGELDWTIDTDPEAARITRDLITTLATTG